MAALENKKDDFQPDYQEVASKTKKTESDEERCPGMRDRDA
jgi:hypothetical protein